jgi:hypothetical protein
VARLVALLLAALALLVPAAPAAADAYLPPAGKVWHGVTAGDDLHEFGTKPGVWQQFVRWGGNYEYVFRLAEGADARVMLHIGTAQGQNMPERISPGAIARGRGDGYLLDLNVRLAEYARPAYIRLMAEMNNCNNAYAAYGCGGGRRDADHSAERFKAAWKRTVLILRGGDVAAIDARLRALGLPRVRTQETSLPAVQAAFIWAPMTGGSPAIGALDPERYWPGGEYVDWVGTSFYSKFPNWGLLERHYQRFAVGHGKPFAFGEWAIWGADAPAFARQLFAWVRSHKRVRMVQYNQGDDPGSVFRPHRYPAAAKVIRGALKSPRFAGAGE